MAKCKTCIFWKEVKEKYKGYRYGQCACIRHFDEPIGPHERADIIACRGIWPPGCPIQINTAARFGCIFHMRKRDGIERLCQQITDDMETEAEESEVGDDD